MASEVVVLRKELHGGRLVDCYADRPHDAWSVLSATFHGRPNAIAVVEGALRLTYAALDRESQAVAAALASDGVGRGDRVAVMLANGADCVRAVVAIIRLGAVVLPIGVRYRAPEIAHILADAEPSALIHEAAGRPELPGDGSADATRFDTSSQRWRDILRSGEPAPFAPPVEEDDPIALLYTSGTTGQPKGAVLTHLNVVHSCLHWREVFGLGEEERALLCVPWTHVAGLCGVLLPILFLGGALMTLAEFNRREALMLAARERITHALMVPAMYGLCLLEPDLADLDLGAWRIAAYGGASMPEPTIRRFAETLPHLSMCNCYGATETASPATIMPPGEGLRHSGSIGRTVPCGEIRVMDERGVEVEPGEDGELWIGGPMVTPGYWRNPEATAREFTAGFWRSGDVGAVDADGFVRISDRKKDMIIRGGFKVYPAEVEGVLAALPGVVEAAVVGRPDDMLGESVVAFLTTAGDEPSLERVRAWCGARLADYKSPTHVVAGVEPLPRNANGKLQKSELRERALALQAAAR